MTSILEPDANGAPSHGYQYDLVVIGGGSGGLAAAKEAGILGKKVALLDYVTPTPQGTSWGLGGTCVNVGCIPKKLMHNAGILGESLSDARAFGWDLPEKGIQHKWETLVGSVQDHIGSLNWGYKVALREKSVEYINARGTLTEAHTVEGTKRNGDKVILTADKIIIAVGGRPRYLGVPGDTDLCITSDDLFSLPSPPKKTLVVGASYIALECAGLLHSLGCDVHVMVRSIFLRGFDQEMAEGVSAYMEKKGVVFVRGCVPTRFERAASGRIKAVYKHCEFGFEADQEYDTVLLAVGRDAVTLDLGLDAAGVQYDLKTGKIPAVNEQTNVPNIYALGDVLEGRQELTPVAIKAGVRLIRRLYAGSKEQMDYDTVPTVVFTPLEYGCVGLAEEEAAKRYGEENVEVYLSHLKPLEWTLNHEEGHAGEPVRGDNEVFCKVITHLADNERVLGVHYLGPHAGEIIQGLAIALKAGATKAHFDDAIGIHPTIAEEFTILSVTRRSGLDSKKKGC